MGDFGLFLQNLIGGIGIGSIYALVALGFALVYRSLGLVNFAHGSIYMIGTYLGIIFYVPLVGIKLPFWLAFIVGCLLTAVLGVGLERILRPLAKLDLTYMLISTIGIGIVLDNLAIIIWGAEGVAVKTPIDNTPIQVAGLIIQPYTLVIIAVGLVLMVALQLFLTRSKTGKAMRATAQDRQIAAAFGIKVNLMTALTFGIGSALAAAAGILAAPVVYVNPSVSVAVGTKGFAAAILGGFGNLPGAALGGVLFGVIESVATGFISSSYKNGIAFVVLIAILMLKPSGILGEKVVEKV